MRPFIVYCTFQSSSPCIPAASRRYCSSVPSSAIWAYSSGALYISQSSSVRMGRVVSKLSSMPGVRG